MPFVRYVALLALAIWIGGLVVVGLFASPGTWRAGGDVVAASCGAVLIVTYVTMKLVGPPPPAFPIRLGLVVAMLAVTAAGRMMTWSTAPMAVTAALGLVLLSWYVRE
jgi:hypothetical protein